MSFEKTTFERAGDLFTPILSFYDRVIDRYRRIEARTPDARVELLLSFLADHAAQLRRELAEWRQSGDAGALDAWFQYSPDREILSDVPELNLDDDASVDDIIAASTSLMTHLIEFCAEAEERAGSGKAADLFEHLKAQAHGERLRLARVAQEIKEL